MKPPRLQASWRCPHELEDSALCDACLYLFQTAAIEYIEELEQDLYMADEFVIELGARSAENLLAFEEAIKTIAKMNAAKRFSQPYAHP